MNYIIKITDKKSKQKEKLVKPIKNSILKTQKFLIIQY